MDASPRRDAARDAMTRYVDALVSILIRTATREADPLLAVSNALVGDNPHIAAEVSASDLRAALFRAYNAYDVNNSRALPYGTLAALLEDFVECYAGHMAVLGPDLCTTPDETWEDRARWDTVGQGLATKAAKLKTGFHRDPDTWVRRWVQVLDVPIEARGASFSDIQALFAGHKTQALLKDLDVLIQVSDVPASPTIDPPLDDYSPARHRSLSPVGDRSAVGGGGPASFRGGGVGNMSVLNRSLTEPAAAAMAPRDTLQVTLDLSQAACSLRSEGKRLKGTCNLLYYVVTFVLVAVVLLMQMGTVETHGLHGTIVGAVVAREFAPGRTLNDVTSVDDVYAWMAAVWVPAVFSEFDIDRFAVRNVLAADPFLRQRRRGLKTFCEPRTNIQAFPFPDADMCYGDDYSTEPIVGQVSGAVYNPVRYDGAYSDVLPDDGGSDFIVRFPTNRTVAQRLAAAGDPTVLPVVVDNLSSARAGFLRLQADRWVDHATAFLECHALFYNPDLDVLAPVKIVFAMSPAGTVLPLATESAPYHAQHHGSVLLARRTSLYDWTSANTARFVLEILVLLIYTIEFALGQFKKCVLFTHQYTSWWAYFTTDFWNVFELVYMLYGLTYVILYVVFVSRDEPAADAVSLYNHDNNGLDSIYPVLVIFGSLFLGMSMIRVLRYLEHVSLMTKAVARILQLVVTQFISLLVLFMVAVVTFAAVAHYFFGHGILRFSTYSDAIQTITQFIIHGVPFAELNSPFADPSYGVFPPIFYWALVISLLLTYTAIVISIFAQASSAVSDELTKNRRDAMDVPSTGRVWSGKALMYNFSNYSNKLIGDWQAAGWIVPVSHKHVIDSSIVTAEVVGKANLRIIVLTSDLEMIAGCSSGVVFVLPPECLAYDLTKPRTALVQGWCSVTKCKAGHEPRHYPKADWMQYVDEWWMQDEVVGEYVAGRDSWMGIEEGMPHIVAAPQELHRRELWLRNAVQAGGPLMNGSAAVTNPTTFAKYTTGCYRGRTLQINMPCRELFGPPKWRSECLVFEFQDVISCKWPVKRLVSSGVHRTQETAAGRKLVITLGDQPVPAYVCGHQERFTQDVVMRPYAGRPIQQYVEDMVVGRFGISHERADVLGGFPDDAARGPPPPPPPRDLVADAMASLPSIPYGAPPGREGAAHEGGPPTTMI